MTQGLDIKYKTVQKIKLLMGIGLAWSSWMLPLTIVLGVFAISSIEVAIMFYICLGFFIGVSILVLAMGIWWINRYYESFQFEMLEEGILICEGVITKNERHIPYGRIQNLNIVRGIIQRQFGIATLLIETAGSSAVAKSPHMTAEGQIPGIRDPNALVQQILPKLGYKREGLTVGIPSEEKALEIDVLREINENLKEIRSLLAERN